jgi:hypothetical protein
MSLASELAQLCRRDLTRLLQELQAFPDDETLWRTLPGTSNSAGNLALHLEGNLREYIGRQLGSVDYHRQRDAEFATRDSSRADLIRRLEEVRELIPSVVSNLSTLQFESTYPEQIWGGPISTQQFLLSLYGHLSYHLGQIDYLRRILTEGTSIKFAGL